MSQDDEDELEDQDDDFLAHQTGSETTTSKRKGKAR